MEQCLKQKCGGTGGQNTESVGAYYVGARMWPQLIQVVPLLKNRGVLNFGLRFANSGGRQICGDTKVIGLCLVDYKLRSKLQKPLGLYMGRRQTTMELGTKVRVKENVLV